MNTVHPYFVTKARAWMISAGGDPAKAGELARWAQIAWYAARTATGAPDHTHGFRYRGVIIAEDGTLLAETRRCGRSRGLQADYVDLGDLKRLTGTDGGPHVVDMALGRIRRAVGQPVAHVRFSEVCEGRAPQA